MEDEAMLVETRFSQNSDNTIFRFNGKNYSVQSCKIMRALEPINFDYIKSITQAIKAFEKSGKRSVYFSLYASLESLKVEDEVLKAIFLMPGMINQVFKISLDWPKQDIKGKIALKIECILKHAD